MKRRLLLALLIALPWLLVVLAGLNLIRNWRFVGSFQAEFSAILSILAALLTALIVVYVIASVYMRRRIARAKTDEQTMQRAFHHRFLHRLDHEIKNPLAIIRVGLLNLRQSAADEQLSSITRLEQQLIRLQKLLEDLRYLTELEEHPLEKSVVHLQDVLDEAVALTAQDGRRVELTVQQVPWPLSPVLGDQDLLLVVFRNLLDNALKFTTPAGRVEVRAAEDGSMAVIEVADTGVGIPAEDLSNIFEDLHRGKNVAEVPGSGLGLAIVQRIITLHNGSIELHSRVEQGTVLKVRLPLAAIKNELRSA
jgi:two-component system, OmpR family, sensor kinase